MSADAYVVDLDELDYCVTRLTGFERYLEERLGDLDRRITALQSVWTGAAAEAQHAAHREWMAGAHDAREGLALLREAARIAHANYTAARAANLRMWG